MKTKSLFSALALISAIILVWIGPTFPSEFPDFPIYLPSDSVRKANSPSIDSLSILQAADGKYYIYCAVCPLTADNGSLQIKIIDTLLFIDQAIPKEYWLTAYVAKNHIFATKQNLSHMFMKAGQLMIDNGFDEERAMLVNKELLLIKRIDVPKNSAHDAAIAGNAMIIALMCFGLIIGFLMLFPAKIVAKVTTFIILTALLFLFLQFIFTATNEALLVTIGAFILGTIFGLIIMATAFPKKKKIAKT